MARIPKKKPVVKRAQAKKPAKKRTASRNEPVVRFTYAIRKDSQNRRYAIDKRTGKRVSVVKAEKALKRSKPILQHKSLKRSRAAKKGWETRKAKALARSQAAKKGWAKRRPIPIVPIAALTPPEQLVPRGIRITPFYPGVVDRIDLYPKVKEAAEAAFTILQAEAWRKREAALTHKPLPPMTEEQRQKSTIRDLIAQRLSTIYDLDQVVNDLWDEFEGEYPMRELYELYFSPEVA